MSTLLEDSKIITHEIYDEMKNSYIDYAMSVIVGRALPDVRDGLKPVHRRILYGMSILGTTPDKPHKKSARIVGEVMGKYHPHGDSSIYDAMVKMAQDFSTRYPLVDGHGNFGSVDGDGAAAMRYTEARMSPFSLQMVRDIDKDTVDFMDNFDGEEKEPVVLPSRVPNLLINGSNGIAVGMATSVPPHNLSDTIDACIKRIDDENCTNDELIKIIKAPDFPTGAMILGREAAKEAYETGTGKITVRSKSEIEETARGKMRIVITEIPFQVNKARLIESMADLVRNKKVEGVSAIRDESNREGMRIVIELKKDVNPNVILNRLYKHTQLQATYSMIMLALVNGEPKILKLVEIIDEYLKHQRIVITRRTKFDLAKAEARAHILEGLLIALDNIDEVIKVIRSSYNDAKEKLMVRFGLSEVQAQAILDMRLARLQGLEREKIENEHNELMEKIAYYKSILADEHKLMGVIKDELLEIKHKYGDGRRTKIVADDGGIDEEYLIDEEDVAVTLTHLGYIKRVPENTYKAQRRGGKGIVGLTTRDTDFVKDLIITSTHDYLMFFTDLGKVYKIKAYEIPEASRTAKGTPVINFLNLDQGERVTAVIPVKEFADDNYLIMVTKNGTIKKTPMSQFDTNRKTGLIAITLKDDDKLIAVSQSSGDESVYVITKKGKSITFPEDDVRSMGRSAGGVRAISLDDGDEVVSMELDSTGERELLVMTKKGFGKRTNLDEYRVQTRGGKGVATYDKTKFAKTGELVGATLVSDDDEIMLINSNGVIIRIRANEISKSGRTTQGVKIMKVEDGDEIVSFAKVLDEDAAKKPMLKKAKADSEQMTLV
ncbi:MULTISPECIES: DNA gyrase subunit A [Mogibacterium]|uniref:DNA gyrase subunit A n=2 Tax=Mogibacterium timidum TaxID=35519 RepID=X8IST8_9FIRM|nr:MULTISPECIES: DNA gyrase subunit A [Mogibacterium]EJU23115.1 DNA gyrase, A subunit [Mogibacterium sp. CM50]EUC52722.1 DNA gyrase, A subunit [Mogibacterium timidum ATCC 33093]NWO22680.1 DNA gyrase subunit A [Mogibacterium timidum]